MCVHERLKAIITITIFLFFQRDILFYTLSKCLLLCILMISMILLGIQGSLLNQLAIANESLGGGTVVVMAERDKEEMELDIAKMEFDFKGTSVICRSGSPLILADLKKV